MLEIIIFILSLIGLTFTAMLSVLIFHLKILFKANNVTIVDSSKPLNIDTLNQELETFGFAFNKEQDLFFSIMNAWQREYGYGKPYDEIAPLICLIFDCEPIVFEYDNRKWLIEFWKGQYGMTTGAEVGIYVTEDEDSSIDNTIFNSINDSELMPISYTLRKNNDVILSRHGRHWWLTGFKLGLFSKPTELTMDIMINFENRDMRDAFIEGLKKLGYALDDILVNDTIVNLTFKKPHAKQPILKNRLITYIVQRYNKHNCKLYNSYTKNYDNTLDKLNFIREQIPVMYKQIMNLGGSEQLLKGFIPTNKKWFYYLKGVII